MRRMKRCLVCGTPGRFYREEPAGYVAWHEWAERMMRHYEQEPCPVCGRLTRWRRRSAA